MTRDLVLQRIRAALADVPGTETPADVAVPRGYRRSHAETDLVELFAERVADYRATVTRVKAAEAATAISQALAGRSVVIPPGFPEALLSKSTRLSGKQGTRLSDEPPLTVAELDAAEGVLTTAALGIAVTGTIVLDAGPGQGRRALTLLPDYHLCVLYEDQIVGDVPEALELLGPLLPLTFISGPSATSDIELDRVEGVHGPRTLDVIIISREDE
jgi:L-lactate dehydrogenase complex protein LldG